jgi:serine/threonine protein kinase
MPFLQGAGLTLPALSVFTCTSACCVLRVCCFYAQSHVSNTKRGTPFYTAPEVTSAGNLTRFADVFSYGVVLWELYMSRCGWQTEEGARTAYYAGRKAGLGAAAWLLSAPRYLT